MKEISSHKPHRVVFAGMVDANHQITLTWCRMGSVNKTLLCREVSVFFSWHARRFKHFCPTVCRVQLVPIISDSTGSTESIASFITENGSLMVLDSATNQYGVGRLYNHIRERQDGINCRITGLTTRGTTLSHDGFSVTSGREIKVVVSGINKCRLGETRNFIKNCRLMKML